MLSWPTRSRNDPFPSFLPIFTLFLIILYFCPLFPISLSSQGGVSLSGRVYSFGQVALETRSEDLFGRGHQKYSLPQGTASAVLLRVSTLCSLY